MITEQKVKSFLVLAEELNFCRAAEHLHITQQALSKQISNLEKDVGGALFLRTTKSVELTPLGAELRALFSETQSSYEEIRSRHLEISRRQLRICCFEDMDISRPLFEARQEMGKKYPGVEYHITTRTRFDGIQGAFERGEIDLAVLPDGVDFPRKEYRKLLLHRGPVSVFASPSLCGGGVQTLGDLRDVVFFVGSEDNQGRLVLEANCREYGFQPRYYGGDPLPPNVERVMIEGGEGAGMGGVYSLLNRDSLLSKIELDDTADIAAVWKTGPSEALPEAFAKALRQKLKD